MKKARCKGWRCTLMVGCSCAALGLLPSSVGAEESETILDNLTVYGKQTVTQQVAQGCIPTNGLVLWYTLDEDASSVTDHSGLSNTGSCVGDAHYVADGRIDGAFELDGNGDSINAGNGSSLDFGTGNFTITAWAKVDSGTTRDVIYGRGGWGTVGNGVILYKGDGNIIFKTMGSNIQSTISAGDSDTDWVHWTALRDGTTMAIYKNGELLQSETKTVRDLTRSVDAYIGKTYESSQLYDFDGLIDQVLIYNRALSTNEICELAACTGTNLPPASLEVHATATFTSNTSFNAGIQYLAPLGDVGMGVYQVQP